MDGGINPSCRKDDVIEAVVFLVLAAIAIVYGILTVWRRQLANPTPLHTTTLPTSDGGTVEVKTVEAPVPQNGIKP